MLASCLHVRCGQFTYRIILVEFCGRINVITLNLPPCTVISSVLNENIFKFSTKINVVNLHVLSHASKILTTHIS